MVNCFIFLSSSTKTNTTGLYEAKKIQTKKKKHTFSGDQSLFILSFALFVRLHLVLLSHHQPFQSPARFIKRAGKPSKRVVFMLNPEGLLTQVVVQLISFFLHQMFLLQVQLHLTSQGSLLLLLLLLLHAW